MSIPVRKNHDIQKNHSFHFPIVARSFIEIRNRQQLFECMPIISQNNHFICIGSGNNTVFTKNAIDCVIHMSIQGKKVLRETSTDTFIQVAAGEDWPNLVSWMIDNNYFGLENLALIPGTTGASPVNNIGAYGVEIKDFIHEIIVFDTEKGQLRHLPKDELGLGYRWSFFKTTPFKKYIITDVILRLPKKWNPVTHYPQVQENIKQKDPQPRDIFDIICQLRCKKIPKMTTVQYHAGSFFRNPHLSPEELEKLRKKHPDLPLFPGNKIPAGWLIEKLGWKGKKAGNVAVSSEHALILVHNGRGDVQELIDLYKAIQEDIAQKTGINLEPEVTLYA